MTLASKDGKKGETKATPFYQVSTALRLILPIFSEGQDIDKPGGVELALTGAWSRVAYKSASTLFDATDGKDAMLRPSMGTLHLAMAFQLPGWASLNLSTTLWSSEKFEKRYLIGLTLADTTKSKSKDSTSDQK